MRTTSRRWIPAALRVSTAGFLLGSAGIHLDLYLTGYRRVPTIGWLFLLQCASAVVFALGVLVADRPAVRIGVAAFVSGTIAGYGLGRAVGLFGFHEVATSAGLVAGLLELGAFTAVGLLLIEAPEAPRAGEARTGWPLASLRRPLPLALGATVLAGVVLAAGVGQAAPSTAATAAAGGGSVRVVIVNFTFEPAHVLVAPGGTVTVHNEDSVTHTLTAVPGSSPYGDFSTGNVAPGETKTFVAPKRPGSYAFYCAIHNFMTGVLTVAG